MHNIKEYHQPRSVPDAVALLQRTGTKTVMLGGGTWLTGEGTSDIEAVVDVAGLGLDKILTETTQVRIGAAATHQHLLTHEVLGKAARSPLNIIGQAAEAMSGLNIRNRATIAGAVVTADPSSPLATVLLACEAEIVVAGTRDNRKTQQGPDDFYRVLPLAGFLSYRQQVLAEGLLITEVRVPVPTGGVQASYTRVARTPKDYPIVCVAALLSAADGIANKVRIAVGGIAPTPIRLNHLEFALEQKSITEWLDTALDTTLSEIQPKGDWRGSAEYRQDMTRVLVRRSIMGMLTTPTT